MSGLVFQSVHEWPCVSEYAWMVLCFRVCMNGLVFQSVLELFFVLFFKVSLVAAIMPVLNCLVFQSVHEWPCFSECA